MNHSQAPSRFLLQSILHYNQSVQSKQECKTHENVKPRRYRVSTTRHIHPAEAEVITSAANRLISEVVQSQRRPLLGPSPG